MTTIANFHESCSISFASHLHGRPMYLYLQLSTCAISATTGTTTTTTCGQPLDRRLEGNARHVTTACRESITAATVQLTIATLSRQCYIVSIIGRPNVTDIHQTGNSQRISDGGPAVPAAQGRSHFCCPCGTWHFYHIQSGEEFPHQPALL